MKFPEKVAPQQIMNTITVGEAIEMLSRHDRTDKLIGVFPQAEPVPLSDGDLRMVDATGPVYSISKHGCRTVAIKVSDE